MSYLPKGGAINPGKPDPVLSELEKALNLYVNTTLEQAVENVFSTVSVPVKKTKTANGNPITEPSTLAEALERVRKQVADYDGHPNDVMFPIKGWDLLVLLEAAENFTLEIEQFTQFVAEEGTKP